MRRAALTLLLLLAAPVQSQVCPVVFTTSNYPSVEGAWSIAETEDRLFDNLLGLCGADAEDFGTSCATGKMLQASAGALVCVDPPSGGGSPLEVREADASPSVASVTQLAFDQTDGFAVSTGGAGLARVDLVVPDNSHAHDGTTISGLAAADTTSGTFDPARLPAATTTAQGAAELATSAETTAGLVVQASDTRLSDSRVPTGSCGGDLGNSFPNCTVTDDSHSHGATTLPPAEDLGCVTCTEGQVMKAGPGGTTVFGAAGSASFTTLDADYGDETVTSVWDLSGAKFEAPNGTTPLATDCDAAGEAGRIFVDTDAATGQQWCICEGVAGWNCGGGGGGSGSPEGAQYHPDREPATGLVAASSDEFEDGFAASWRWGNQGSSTDTIERDSAHLVAQQVASGFQLRARWLDAPASGDWIVAAKFFALNFQFEDQFGGGIVILAAGSEATPTDLRTLVVTITGSGGTTRALTHHRWNSYTSSNGQTAGYTTDAITFPVAVGAQPLYALFRFTDSSNLLEGFYSLNGYDWKALGSSTLSGNPVSVGRIGWSNEPTNADVRAMWFRTCTSSACVTDLAVGD